MNTLNDYYRYREIAADRIIMMQDLLRRDTHREIMMLAKPDGFKKLWEARLRVYDAIHRYEKQIDLITRIENLVDKMLNA